MSTLTFKFLSPEKLEENFATLSQIKHKPRLEQIQLIKAVITDIKASTISDDEKAKVITGAMLFIKNKIADSYALLSLLWSAENSSVYKNINPTIGADKNNVLDAVSIKEALLTFRNYLFAHPKKILESSNLTLKVDDIAKDINRYVSPNLNSELHTIKLHPKGMHWKDEIHSFNHAKLKHVTTVVKQAKLHQGKDVEDPTNYMDEAGKRKYKDYMAQLATTTEVKVKEVVKEPVNEAPKVVVIESPKKEIPKPVQIEEEVHTTRRHSTRKH